MTNIISIIPSLNHRKEIGAICDPLKKLEISYFSHAQLDKQGRFSVICNNPEFMELYYQKKYFNIDIHHADTKQLGNLVIWDTVPRDGRTLQMGKDAMDLGIQHTFTIIEKNKEGCNYYHFSTHLENEMMNQVYLANLDSLKLFINYFKKKVAQSNKLSRAHEIKVNIDSGEGYIIKPGSNSVSAGSRHKFLQQIVDECDQQQIKQDLPSYQITLSKREIQVIKFIVQGLTGKNIADLLSISRRTVEHHVENIKNKLGANSKADLVRMGIHYLD